MRWLDHLAPRRGTTRVGAESTIPEPRTNEPARRVVTRDSECAGPCAAGVCPIKTARLAASAIDIVLAGNHEARMLADREGVGGAALATLAARGWPHAAAALGDWLITHAGVHPKLARELPFQAEECRAEINERWHRRAPGEGGDPLLTGSDRPGEGKFPTAGSSGPTRSNGAARASHAGRSSDMSRNLSRGCCPGAGGRSTSAPAMGASPRLYEHQASGDGGRWSLTRPQRARQSSRAFVLERPPE